MHGRENLLLKQQVPPAVIFFAIFLAIQAFLRFKYGNLAFKLKK